MWHPVQRLIEKTKDGWLRLFPRRKLRSTSGEFDTPARAAELNNCMADRLESRRQALAASGFKTTDMPPTGSLGLCFSGGGIRSATISLGVAQALACGDDRSAKPQNRLFDFDYISTVSGGGYFGSFLVSLFMTSKARGLKHSKLSQIENDELSETRKFGERALTADSRTVFFEIDDASANDDKVFVGNPVWWLREHSRYLAPNGPTDYLIAATYIFRNWLAMLSVFALPIAAIFLVVAGIQIFGISWFIEKLSWLIPQSLNLTQMLNSTTASTQLSALTCCGLIGSGAKNTSVLMPIAAFFLVLSVASGFAFWLTEWLPDGVKWVGKSISERLTKTVYLGGALASAGSLGVSFFALKRMVSTLTPLAECWMRVAIYFVGIALALSFGVFCSNMRLREQNFTVEMRRKLTRLQSHFHLWTLVFLGLGVIDAAAIYVLASVEAQSKVLDIESGRWLAYLAPLSPAVAWLLNKLPTWLESEGGKVAPVVKRHVWTLALVVGAAMYGLFALYIDVAIKALLSNEAVFGAPGGSSLPTFLALSAIVGTVLLTTGKSTNFINLSSMHGLYAARLTRAFLGGSNQARLRRDIDRPNYARITESHRKDDIDVAIYQQVRSIAPLHLINVTLNETRSRQGSQLVERDRKGVPIVFGPEGMFLDAARKDRIRKRSYYTWEELREAEGLSVGQLCAISGAAASPGMGAETTLGGSLALTFANVRLGYWWKVGKLVHEKIEESPSFLDRAILRATGWLRTYFYLANEMTGRYSRDYERLYLSDGGHFDNSGAYELLRRGVPVIVVSDNGADPNFEFDDLENLIRKARVDLGISLNVSDSATVANLFGKDGQKAFLNSDTDDWRERAKQPGGQAVALLLDGYARKSADDRAIVLKHRIVWLKPQVFDALPHDVVGYSLKHKTFPQEPTANQFFDEEQWESYRAVGSSMIKALFALTRSKQDIFRSLVTDLNTPKKPVTRNRARTGGRSSEPN